MQLVVLIQRLVDNKKFEPMLTRRA